MSQAQRNKLSNAVKFIFVAWSLVVLSGCAVVMAVRQPDYKNLNVLSKGVPRTKIIAELGAPLLTEERDGKKVDIFAFKQGYGKGNKAARAFFHAAADVWTLCLWEVIGTPAEAIASGRKVKIEVIYDKNDLSEKINYIDKNYPDKGERPQDTTKAAVPEKEKLKTEPIGNREVPIDTQDTQPEAKLSDKPTAATYADYYRLVYKTVSNAVVKPEGVTSGTINASFTLLADGSLQGIEILESSSTDPALRAAVEKAIRDSAPFPAFPDDIKAEGKKKFTITLEFRNK